MRIFKIQEYLSQAALSIKLFHDDLIKDKHELFKDVSYGMDKRQYYRVYEGHNRELPLVFFIHGGGWWHGSPKLLRTIGSFFHKRGYTVVLPAYRLVPKHTYPKQVSDVMSALVHAIKHLPPASYNQKVAVVGFSAGGELGAHLVFDAEAQRKYDINKGIFKCFISLAGVLDFTQCKSAHAKRLIKNYLGKKYSIDQVNPKELIKEEINIPVLCIHGSKDKLIDIRNAISFVHIISRHGGMAKIQRLKGYHHSDIMGLFIGKSKEETDELLAFIEA